MRNETVERIVNLLFQDVEMTDEVQALYDETMSNCQERYQDMTSTMTRLPPSSRA